MGTKLSKKEKEIIRTGVKGMGEIFEQYQDCETYEEVKKISEDNAKIGKENWFKNWEKLLSKIEYNFYGHDKDK